MANSKIVITFNRDLDVNQEMGFKISNFGSSYFVDQNFVWKTNRLGFGQVTKGIPTSTVGERSAINFIQSYNLDWDIGGTTHNISRVLNVVTIETTSSNIMFSDFYIVVTPPVSIVDVTAIITNNEDGVFEVDSLVFSEADTNPCQNAKVSVTMSSLATNINQPFSEVGNTDNPIVFEVLRNSFFDFDVENANGLTYLQNYTTPSILNPNDFDIQINNSPNGATIVINSNNTSVGFNLLDLEYSLDNVDFQTSNVFNGLLSGNYTLYIKDQLGCSISVDFSVSDVFIDLPYFYISKANSIRFANRITFGDSSNYKNDENTLSCESQAILPYKQIQLFQSADVITTQFKSNFENNIVNIITDSGNVPVTVTQMSNNIGNTESLDARKYDLGGGKTAIYFVNGNMYDLNTGLPTGQNHYLNGGLPIWAKTGTYVKIDSEWFLIEDILYDESKNAEIIVISSNYTGVDVAIIASSIYNIFDYEVYEFTIDMVDYINETIKVEIVASDTNFGTINYLSEDINVQVRHLNTLEIKYFNTDNTDVFYATGIKHLIRIPFYKIGAIPEQEYENNKTDTTTVLLSSDIFEANEFTFEPLTKELFLKLIIGLSCRNVTIDGVSYVKNSSFDYEGPLEDTNLYVLKAKMIKTGGTFKSQSDGNIDYNFGSSLIPGLIDIGNDAFLKYN